MRSASSTTACPGHDASWKMHSGKPSEMPANNSSTGHTGCEQCSPGLCLPAQPDAHAVPGTSKRSLGPRRSRSCTGSRCVARGAAIAGDGQRHRPNLGDKARKAAETVIKTLLQ